MLTVMAFFATADRAYYEKFLKAAAEMKELSGGFDDRVITAKDIRGLPDTVQRYLNYAGVVGRKRISSARVRHTGYFKPSGSVKWYPITGEYFYTAKKPGFIWYGKINMLPFFSVTAEDAYFLGRGSMEIRLMSLFDAGSAQGREINISSFGRFISEMEMFPTIFADGSTVAWEKIDFESARAIVSDNEMGWSADFTFKPDGPIEKVQVKRFRDTNEGYKLDMFTGTFRDWKEIGGFMVPTEIDGQWDLARGPLEYVRFKVDSITFE